LGLNQEQSEEPKAPSVWSQWAAVLLACLAIFCFPLAPLAIERIITGGISAANAASCLVTFSAAYAVITKIRHTSMVCWFTAIVAAGCFGPLLIGIELDLDLILWIGFGVVVGFGIVERIEMHVFSNKPIEI
jgi:hypothetical protein